MQTLTPWAAVIGSPIGHSLSPVLHLAAYRDLGLNIDYRRIEITKETIDSFLASWPEGLVGLSVTMPLKQVIIPLLSQVDGLAKAVGAVNTVVPFPEELPPDLIPMFMDWWQPLKRQKAATFARKRRS